MEECRYCNGFGYHVINNDETEPCSMCCGTGYEAYDDERLESINDEE